MRDVLRHELSNEHESLWQTGTILSPHGLTGCRLGITYSTDISDSERCEIRQHQFSRFQNSEEIATLHAVLH